MKRKIALLLAVVFLVVALMPLNVLAAEDKDLENAIKAVKEKIDIPASLTEFSYGITTDNDKKIWNLNWNPKDGGTGGINVSVDASGAILSYYHYTYTNYEPNKLPKVNRQTAQKIGESFIKKVNPAVFSQLKFINNIQYLGVNTEYYFNYTRMVNGIPFPDNNVYISVSTTGDVQSYNCNWTNNIDFPDAGKVISMEAAQKAYKDKLGLRLVYNQTYDQQNPRVYVEYTSRYDSSYVIDALTGDKIQLGYFYGGMGGAGGMYDKMAASQNAKPAEVVLTPEEQKAVEEVSKLISKDEAEKKARALSVLELTSDYKLTSANLYKSWESKNSYSWNLSFSKELNDENKNVLYTSVTIDALNATIIGFYRGLPYVENGKSKYDEAAAKTAVETFLKNIVPDKFNNSVYEETTNNIYLKAMGKELPAWYSFNYIRKVNGIPFIRNNISVTFDAVSGKVTNFNLYWFNDTVFPPIDKAISLEDAYQKMFSTIGLELQYKIDNRIDPYGKMPIRKPGDKPQVKLVYAVKPDKPLFLDAFTGGILNANGEPYVEIKPVTYTDIAGNFAEDKIKTLAEYGIALAGSEFKPDSKIVQIDFLYLLAKSMNYYGSYSPADSGKQADELYKFLTDNKIIRGGEKAPGAAITKEDAVKFVIRALKYDKVADLKDIYKTTFKDTGSINPNLAGYVAIAQGLGIVSGYNGYFSPKAELTRAQAAVIIYNYMQN